VPVPPERGAVGGIPRKFAGSGCRDSEHDHLVTVIGGEVLEELAALIAGPELPVAGAGPAPTEVRATPACSTA
jgi:hypothetical protein